MKRRSILPWSIGLVAIAALAVWFFVFRDKAEAVTYRTEAIDRGNIEISISATGALEAVTTVQVGSQVSGTISKLYVDFNDKVKEGQLLAQLDPTFLQASVNEQSANVDRAQAQFNQAQRDYDRAKGLFERSLVAQTEMDAATTSLESAKASVAQANAALQRAQVNLKYATIRAPISGVVISRDVDVGQTVAASLSAPTLYTIANDLTKMRVEASVDEADIGTIRVGLPVSFRVDAYPDDLFTGVVSQVRLKPVNTQNVVTYVVIIDVENKDEKLMPGMTATVTIVTAKRENVVRAPLAATRFTPAGNGNSATGGNGQQFGGGTGTRNSTGGANAATRNGNDSGRQIAQTGQPSPGDSTMKRQDWQSRRQRFDSAGGGSAGGPGGRPRGDWQGRRAQEGDSTGGDPSMRPHRRPDMGDSTMRRQPASDTALSPDQPKLVPVTLWVLDANGQPRQIRAMRGIQSTRYVELISDELKEGDQVIVGTNGTAATPTVQGQNPFMPRMGPGGGRGR